MSDADDAADGAGERETGSDADPEAAADRATDAASDADAAEPSPADVVDDLDRPVILFDGVCNLCNGFVRFVVKFDDEGRFRFAPLQGPVGQELLGRHGLDDEDFDTMVLVEPDGEHATKSAAALSILRRLDGPWPLLSPARHLPRRLRDGVYDLVAQHRYSAFGKREEACELPEPELRERFAERSLE